MLIGTSSPSALAALRLMTSLYLVGNWTGRARSLLCCRGERRDQDLELSRLKAITKISRDCHVVVFRNSEADAGNFIVTRFGCCSRQRHANGESHADRL